MTDTQTPVTGNTPQPTITPEVGKRYVTRGGWITPPWKEYFAHYRGGNLEPISEYVEPTVTTAPPDTFRRDLIARIYVAMVGSSEYTHLSYTDMATHAIAFADTLIEAMEGKQ